jgi:hypothetical protein
VLDEQLHIRSLADVGTLRDEPRLFGRADKIAERGAELQLFRQVSYRYGDVRISLEKCAHDRVTEVAGRAGYDDGA